MGHAALSLVIFLADLKLLFEEKSVQFSSLKLVSSDDNGKDDFFNYDCF